MPEFFKPEDLFYVMKNYEDQKETEEKLHYFKLDNDNIRCQDASTLNALIPYVKRLVTLFPHLKEKVKEKCSSPNLQKTVFQNETKRNVENIRQSALDFKPGALILTDFLDGDEQIWQLRMMNADVWTGITKVYQALQNTSSKINYSSEGHYTVLDLERLLTVNRMLNLNAVLASVRTPHLVMIACGTNKSVDDELQYMFKELFNILKQKKKMKVILTTQSEDDTSATLQQIASKALDKGVKTTDEKLVWNELIPSSQSKLLEKTVIFQGIRVALNQLTSVESVTDCFPLTDLLQETELRIGEEPVPSGSSGYTEKCYVGRTFIHNIVIRQEILRNKRLGKFTDLRASTEMEFEQLCQQNPTSSVHWLVKEKSGKLLWRQSQGDLKTLRKYINAHKTQSYAPSDLDKLLHQAKLQRIMLIADKAGMGKTTALTHLSKQIKQNSPANWLVRIDLNDYTELLEAQKGKKMDKGWVFEFISNKVLKLESHFEKQLFEKSFEGNEVNQLVVMVDGLDEISPYYKETVFDMLQFLKQTSLEQLWVTTRPHLREELEDSLQQLSYTLQPFSEDEQVELLKKFWLQNLYLEDKDQHHLEIYAKTLIRKLAQSISDKDREFTGIPLQIHMLAEVFEEEFTSFCHSEKSEPELPEKLELLGLYKRFIERKYDICYKEKPNTTASKMTAGEQQSSYFKCTQEHQLLALEALFPEDQVAYLKKDHHYAISDEELSGIGIVQRNKEGKLKFIHRNFAEFYVAEFLIKQLTEETFQSTLVQDFLLNEVLLKPDYHVIRAFLDGLLGISMPSKEVLEGYGKKIDEQWKVREAQGPLPDVTTALFNAAAEDNVNIIGFIVDSLKSADSFNTVTEMMLAKNNEGRNAWLMAGENHSLQTLNKIWEWVEEVHLHPRYNLLLPQDEHK
jgi:hypothetical protein